MRSLKRYIAESVKTYDYTIKIAGEVDKNFLDLFAYNLKKFDPIDISKPVSTPIQKSPYGFPNLSNQPITIIKCRFRYPATEPMVQQMAQLLGYNVNCVRCVKTSYDDSVDSEMMQYENQMKDSPVLTHGEMGSADDAKEASKAYGDSYLGKIKNAYEQEKTDQEFAAAKTKPAFDPFKPYLDDKAGGSKSPMSKITRPALPKTGAHRS